MPKTVWILGAGFACSLGAPLLVDLFRQEEPVDAEAYFPEVKYAGLIRDMMAAQIAFNWGKTIERLWEDAEQFLAFVDDAYSGGAPERKQRLTQLADRAKRHSTVDGGHHHGASAEIVHMMHHDLQRASRRALAAETSRFMMSGRDGELWLPYREWAASLHPDIDTIVTFNYDVLLDELGKKAPFTIPLPHESPLPGKIAVLKLHGSVNWLADGATHLRLDDYEALMRPSGVHPAIAAPGRSKSENGGPPFRGLWELAQKAITYSDRVCFVGYRFPPTDALARLRICGALASDDGPDLRRIDIVLGPGTESDDSRRLAKLLEASRGRRFLERPRMTAFPRRRLRVIRQPIWAEDFLTSYRELRDELDW